MADGDRVYTLPADGSTARWAEASGGGGGSSSVLSASVTLDNDQILALPTTTPEIIPAPGADKIAIPFLMVLAVTLAVDYTNINAAANIILKVPSPNSLLPLLAFQAPDALVADILAVGQSGVNITPSRTGDAPLVGLNFPVNRAYLLTTSNSTDGAFTGGDPANSMNVTVLYTVVDV